MLIFLRVEGTYEQHILRFLHNKLNEPFQLTTFLSLKQSQSEYSSNLMVILIGLCKCLEDHYIYVSRPIASSLCHRLWITYDYRASQFMYNCSTAFVVKRIQRWDNLLAWLVINCNRLPLSSPDYKTWSILQCSQMWARWNLCRTVSWIWLHLYSTVHWTTLWRWETTSRNEMMSLPLQRSNQLYVLSEHFLLIFSTYS